MNCIEYCARCLFITYIEIHHPLLDVCIPRMLVDGGSDSVRSSACLRGRGGRTSPHGGRDRWRAPGRRWLRARARWRLLLLDGWRRGVLTRPPWRRPRAVATTPRTTAGATSTAITHCYYTKGYLIIFLAVELVKGLLQLIC